MEKRWRKLTLSLFTVFGGFVSAVALETKENTLSDVLSLVILNMGVNIVISIKSLKKFEKHL